MQHRTVLVFLLITAYCIVAKPSPTASASSEPNQQGVNVPGSPHSDQMMSDRLEAIKRYILERLNVSDNRRFNRSSSAPPTTTTHHQHPPHQTRQVQQLTPTQTFNSLPEAMNFYAKELAADRRGRGQAKEQVEDDVQRRRKRLHSRVDEAGGTEVKKRGASRRRSSRKRRQRKQIKLKMTPDTGQNVASAWTNIVLSYLLTILYHFPDTYIWRWRVSWPWFYGRLQTFVFKILFWLAIRPYI